MPITEAVRIRILAESPTHGPVLLSELDDQDAALELLRYDRTRLIAERTKAEDNFMASIARATAAEAAVLVLQAKIAQRDETLRCYRLRVAELVLAVKVEAV